MLNKVQLIGLLGKDPETKNLDSGKKVATFSLATSEKYKDKSGEKKEITTWHNIVLWSPLAEIAEKYLKKGSKVYLEGKISNRSYENKDKQKVYVTEIVCSELKLLDSKPSAEPKSGYSEPNLQAQSGEDSDLPF